MAGFKIQDITGKLGFLRSYSSLVIPLIITLVGLSAFIPIHIINGKLQEKIGKASITAGGKRITQLIKTADSSQQWQVEKVYQDACQRDANEISRLARQTSERELLSYKVFPKPKGSSTLVFEGFGRKFQDAVDKLLVGARAMDCPSEAELNRHIGKAPKSSSSTVTMSPFNLAGRTNTGDSSKRDELIIDEICRERAESILVYINPGDLSGYEFWQDYKYLGMDESVEDCWYWQIGYWIIEDIIKTIEAVNAGCDNVLTSAAKRLLDVSFASDGKTSLAEQQQRPSYVTETETGLTTPCTRRVTNEQVDVVHFHFSILIGNKFILPFMRELCSAKEHQFAGFSGDGQQQLLFQHNQITVLRAQSQIIDSKNEEHSRYRYGDGAVFQLDLVCEYVFDKSGYAAIKPQTVKQVTGDITDNATANPNPN